MKNDYCKDCIFVYHHVRCRDCSKGKHWDKTRNEYAPKPMKWKER